MRGIRRGILQPIWAVDSPTADTMFERHGGLAFVSRFVLSFNRSIRRDDRLLKLTLKDFAIADADVETIIADMNAHRPQIVRRRMKS